MCRSRLTDVRRTVFGLLAREVRATGSRRGAAVKTLRTESFARQKKKKQCTRQLYIFIFFFPPFFRSSFEKPAVRFSPLAVNLHTHKLSYIVTQRRILYMRVCKTNDSLAESSYTHPSTFPRNEIPLKTIMRKTRDGGRRNERERERAKENFAPMITRFVSGCWWIEIATIRRVSRLYKTLRRVDDGENVDLRILVFRFQDFWTTPGLRPVPCTPTAPRRFFDCATFTTSNHFVALVCASYPRTLFDSASRNGF
jgi:hypothetical protein